MEWGVQESLDMGFGHASSRDSDALRSTPAPHTALPSVPVEEVRPADSDEHQSKRVNEPPPAREQSTVVMEQQLTQRRSVSMRIRSNLSFKNLFTRSSTQAGKQQAHPVALETEDDSVIDLAHLPAPLAVALAEYDGDGNGVLEGRELIEAARHMTEMRSMVKEGKIPITIFPEKDRPALQEFSTGTEKDQLHAYEILQGFHALRSARQKARNYLHLALAGFLLCFILLAAIGGMMWFVIEQSKETSVSGESELRVKGSPHAVRTASTEFALSGGIMMERTDDEICEDGQCLGNPVQVAEASYEGPLSSTMPDEVLKELKSFTVRQGESSWLQLQVSSLCRHVDPYSLHGTVVVLYTPLGEVRLDGANMDMEASVERHMLRRGFTLGGGRRGLWDMAGSFTGVARLFGFCANGVRDEAMGEEGVDCGGECAACPSCSDGVWNQGERGIDCGGPCPTSCPITARPEPWVPSFGDDGDDDPLVVREFDCGGCKVAVRKESAGECSGLEPCFVLRSRVNLTLLDFTLADVTPCILCTKLVIDGRHLYDRDTPDELETLSLAPDAFSGLFHLQTLEVYGHHVVINPGALQPLGPTLRTLVMQSNTFVNDTLPPDGFGSLRLLEILDLRNNRLRTLPPDIFRGLEFLKVLDVSHNALKKMQTATVSGLSRVEFVSFAANGLRRVEARAVEHTPSLRVLDLSSNSLHSASFAATPFVELANVETLDLRTNLITVLTRNFFRLLGVAAVRAISLQENRLHTIELASFDGLDDLAILDLQSNHLNESGIANGAFVGLVGLQELHLGNNELGGIPRGIFHGLWRVKTINLFGNRIHNVSTEELVKTTSAVQALDLRDNPLACYPAGSWATVYLDATQHSLGPCLPAECMIEASQTLTAAGNLEAAMGAVSTALFSMRSDAVQALDRTHRELGMYYTAEEGRRCWCVGYAQCFTLFPTTQKAAGSFCSSAHECKTQSCRCGVCADDAGTVPDGSRCDDDDDCVSGHCNGARLGQRCSGVCEAKAADGKACFDDRSCQSGRCQCGSCATAAGVSLNFKRCGEDAHCNSSAYCDSAWVDGSVWGLTLWCGGTCHPRTELGGACDEHAQCRSGWCRCGTCATEEEGDIQLHRPCSSNGVCGSGWCEGDGWWGACSGLCERPRGLGEACGEHDGCESGWCRCGSCATAEEGLILLDRECSGNGVCQSGYCEGDGAWGGCSGVCKRQRGFGEACTEDAGCESGWCLCGTCATDEGYLTQGVACSTNGDCLSGFCEGDGIFYYCNGMCEDKAAVGEPCREDAGCVSGECRCGSCADDDGKLMVGRACSSDASCQSGLCDGDGWFGCGGVCVVEDP